MEACGAPVWLTQAASCASLAQTSFKKLSGVADSLCVGIDEARGLEKALDSACVSHGATRRLWRLWEESEKRSPRELNRLLKNPVWDAVLLERTFGVCPESV
jgi:hypothetical protein